VTFDKDFGELVVRERARVKGLIPLRFVPRSPQQVAEKIRQVLRSGIPLEKQPDRRERARRPSRQNKALSPPPRKENQRAGNSKADLEVTKERRQGFTQRFTPKACGERVREREEAQSNARPREAGGPGEKLLNSASEPGAGFKVMRGFSAPHQLIGGRALGSERSRPPPSWRERAACL